MSSFLKTAICKDSLTSSNLEAGVQSITFFQLSPVGHMDLSKGILKDFASVARNGDVNVTYNQTEQKAILALPFTFRKLKVRIIFV